MSVKNWHLSNRRRHNRLIPGMWKELWLMALHRRLITISWYLNLDLWLLMRGFCRDLGMRSSWWRSVMGSRYQQQMLVKFNCITSLRAASSSLIEIYLNFWTVWRRMSHSTCILDVDHPANQCILVIWFHSYSVNGCRKCLKFRWWFSWRTMRNFCSKISLWSSAISTLWIMPRT